MKARVKKTVQIMAVLIGALLSGVAIYLWFNPQFGGSITETLKKEYARSGQWDGEKFINQTQTVMDIKIASLPAMVAEYTSNIEKRTPKKKLPCIPFDVKRWQNDERAFKFIWFGHSVGLMRIDGKNVLIDPMFGPDTSPVGPFRSWRYTDSTLQIIDRLPFIDAVCVTHDHYDHLDYDSFQKLADKVGHYYVPLGVRRHLLRWGIAKKKITVFDWWESAKIDSLEMTFVPARHFSGRGLFDRSKSLWGGWTFVAPASRVYWSGDGGYGPHFLEIGKKLGPFDYAFLECGQYNPRWHAIHMYPEETVQAAIDVNAKVSIPIHWGAFTLALHDWKDPVERFSAEAKRKNIRIAMPQLGEIIELDVSDRETYWWHAYH